MKSRLFLFLLLLFIYSGTRAQDWSSAKEPAALTSVNDAARLAEQIVNAAGLTANFRIAEAQVPNAMAVVHQGKRYILYNPRFISILTRATGTRWAAVSVLAHEIGHHLYSNSVNKGKIPLATELEADEFSGYVLKKMGASLAEAEAAMKILGTTYATRTHPASADRIFSISEGWKNAGGIITGEEEHSGSITMNRSAGKPTAAVRTGNTDIYAEKFTIKVRFNASPGSPYYVTNSMKLVKAEHDQLRMIGSVRPTGDSDFPYTISDDTGFKIYVARNGDILNSRGRKVGRMEEAGY